MTRAPLLALVLSGCINTIRFPPDLWSSTSWWESGTPRDSGDTADPPAEEAPRHIVEARSACNAELTAWDLDARTDGWVGDARVNLFRIADQQAEEHTLKLVASDPEGAWDELHAGPLPDATPAAAQVPEQNTRFDCEGDADTLTFVVRIWDGDLLDCAVWGADPPAAMAAIRTLDPDVLGLGGCREMGG